MKKIALSLLLASTILTAGCKRPAPDAPVVAASPTPRVLTEEEQRQEEAARAEKQRKKQELESQTTGAMPMVEAVPAIPAASLTPTPSPTKR